MHELCEDTFHELANHLAPIRDKSQTQFCFVGDWNIDLAWQFDALYQLLKNVFKRRLAQKVKQGYANLEKKSKARAAKQEAQSYAKVNQAKLL